MIAEEKIDVVNQMLPHLDERTRRLLLSSLPLLLDDVTAKDVSEAFEVNANTLTQGKKDLLSGEVLKNEKGKGRVRRAGGGRKKITETQPGILDALRRLLADSTYGDPETPLQWTTKSRRNLANELRNQGYKVGHVTVGSLLEELGFSLQGNRKNLQEGEPHPDRDAQFQHINATAAAYLEAGEPVISVDCKKKENIGEYANNGVEYRPKGQPEEVKDHDFVDKELGKAIPYGIYDDAAKEGFVNVGITKDTAEFAVTSIGLWWSQMGKERYPEAERLYITADGGGSNSSRNRLWKKELQKFANESGLTIEVSHFPPGTSKWNKIEHRLFSQISKNWRGRPLKTLGIIVSLISRTTTATGLRVRCQPDDRVYETGIKVSDAELSAINLVRNEFHGEWNYVISPQSRS